MHRPSALAPGTLEDIGGGVRAHPTALIAENCAIGEGTVIRPYVQVLPGAVIGERCKIGPYSVVSTKSRLGNGVVLECRIDVWPLVELEDDVFVGPNAVFTNDLTPRATEPKGGVDNWVPTLVKRGASIGANATIVCSAIVGRYAVIGSGSVVTRDVRDFALVKGIPARQTAWVCKRNHKEQRWTKLDFSATNRCVCPTCSAEYVLLDGMIVTEIGSTMLVT